MNVVSFLFFFFFFYETRIQTLFTVFYCTFIEVFNVISKHHSSIKIVTQRSGSNRYSVSKSKCLLVGRLFTDNIHVNFTKTLARCRWKPEASSMIKTLNETLNFVWSQIIRGTFCSSTPLPKNDVTVSARHFPRKYDRNMAVCVHFIRPI